MERLREQHHASDPVVAEAAKMLGELAPAGDVPGQKERVRRSLAARLEGRRKRRPIWVVLPAVGLFALGAYAAERAWNFSPAAPAPAPAPAPAREVTKIWTARSPEPEPVIDEVLEPPAAPEPPAENLAPPKRTKAKKAAPQPREDETMVLFEAVRALRREHRPEVAAELLAKYLKRHPEGALHEEGLALAIEAAAAAKNNLRAAELAREYIARYPQGRFRAQADSAIAAR